MSRKRPFARAARPQKVAGQMNATEREYETLFLLTRKARGEVLDWWYERVTLKLADDTRFTPDFFVLLASGEVEFHEVKGGFIHEDAKVKLKVAPDQFPFRFYLAQKRSQKNGGGWHVDEVASSTWQEAA